MNAKADKVSRILITAGPTREKIDPVRFISNYSTGTFGYEIAREARRRGHAVTLVSGPTVLRAPRGVKLIGVESALEMKKAVVKNFGPSDCLIMASAVADWRVKSIAKNKIKKLAGKNRVFELVANPDILKELGRKKKGRILAGFALETEDLEKNALRKLKEKNLDIVIANKHKRKTTAFGDNLSDILVIDKYGRTTRFSRKSKREMAKIILDKVEEFGL